VEGLELALRTRHSAVIARRIIPRHGDEDAMERTREKGREETRSSLGTGGKGFPLE
jgi:hypothetical protein